MDIDTNAELIQDFYYLPEDLEDYLGRVVAADQIKDLKTRFQKGNTGRVLWRRRSILLGRR